MDVKLDDKDKVVTSLCSLPRLWYHFENSISFSTTETFEFDSIVRVLLSKDVPKKSSIKASTPKEMVATG